MDESDHERLFASPTVGDHPKVDDDAQSLEGPDTASHNVRFNVEEAKEASLRRELEGVRNINQVIEGVISTLEKANSNMSTVSNTVNNASTLLNTWTRILSQTEHNQRLILDPNWNGATQDLADAENEALLRQQAAERKAAEEERRKEDARRRVEEEERRRQVGAATAGAPRGTRGTRGRGRDLPRGGTSGYSTGGSSSGIHGARSTSGIGRGLGSTRTGRSRGVR